jgi:hypothetical protein
MPVARCDRAHLDFAAFGAGSTQVPQGTTQFQPWT